MAFNGEDITGLRPHHICHKGIAKTFQVVKPFAHLSALENVLVGCLFGVRGSKRADQTLAEAKGSSEPGWPGLQVGDHGGAVHDCGAKRAPGGAGAGNVAPRLLLLDEFMAGLGPGEIQLAIDLVKSIRDSGG